MGAISTSSASVSHLNQDWMAINATATRQIKCYDDLFAFPYPTSHLCFPASCSRSIPVESNNEIVIF